MTTILAVDDETALLNAVRRFLSGEGFTVVTSESGEETLAILEEREVDLVVLDWMMPGLNGLDVLREIRQKSDIPVIFLTAKGEELDKLLGLEMGADDYLTKPFSLRELAARIRVILRRMERSRDEKQEDMCIRRELALEPETHRAWIGEKELVLTPAEFRLLRVLAERPGRVYSRSQLLRLVLGEEYLGYERSIDTHVYNLRKKMGVGPEHSQYIRTIHGVGYKLGGGH